MNTHTRTCRVVALGGTTLTIAGLGMSSAHAVPTHAQTPAGVTAPAMYRAAGVMVLSYGDTGHYVRVLQKRLNARMSHNITVDGSFGPATLRDVKRFQRTEHISVDGHVGPTTWKHLGGFPGKSGGGSGGGGHHHDNTYPTLRYGDTGSAVKRAQRLLNTDLPGRIAVDGSFGPTTLATVKRFERSQGDMVVNGVIGKATWKRLERPHKTHPPKPPKHHKKKVIGWVASVDHSANVRSGPGFNYRVVSHKGKGGRVTGRSANKHWLKISGGHYINKGVLEYKSSSVHAVNGKNPGHLCAIPHKYNTPDSFAPGYTKNRTRYLNCHALTQLNKLERAYHKHYGKYALIDLAYRTLKEQWYWYNKLGSPRAAYPGYSNHGLGEAIDFTERRQGHFDWGQYGNRWLLKNAGTYGFANPFAAHTNGEAYHFNFVG